MVSKFELVSLAVLINCSLEGVNASPAFYCESKEDEKMRGFGGLSLYQSCGQDLCDCKAFDLMCLRRSGPELDVITLESKYFEQSRECPSTECICNTSVDWPAATYVATTDGSLLSEPALADVPTYPELELAAKFDMQTSKFDRPTPETALYKEIMGLNGSDAASDPINDPVNEGKPYNLPQLYYNPNVGSVQENCTAEEGEEAKSTSVTCDLHYKLNWDYLLTAQIACTDILSNTIDPCFGTHACLCTNGFFRVATNMPEPPVTYLGTSNATTLRTYQAFLRARASLEKDKTGDKETTDGSKEDFKSDSDGLNGVEIAGIVIGVVAALVLAIALMQFGIKKYRKKQAGQQSVTKVQPLPQQTLPTQVMTTEMAADIVIEDDDHDGPSKTPHDDGSLQV